MKNIAVNEIGGSEKLVIIDAPEPQIIPNHITANVEAAGVNYIDVYQREGLYPLPLPYTPGFEGVGYVAALGPGVEGLKVGDRIAWVNALGSYAEQVSIAASQVIRVPASFTMEECLLFQAITAQYLVHEYRPVKSGDTVLVHAAAGGVGQILVQWLKHLGAYVIGTVSSDAKAAIVRALGADEVINYVEKDFLAEVRKTTSGRGVNLAFDSVGRETLHATVEALAARGTAVSYGSASGVPPAIDPAQLIPGAKRLGGGAIFTYIADPVELQARAAAVIDAIQAGWLKIAQGKTYRLERATDAHRDIQSRGTQGKLFLVP